jgi:two-component system LytT family response regulator
MLRAIIIDDELPNIQSLAKDLAQYCPQVEVVAEAQSGKEGLLAIKNEKPDLVFLDVAMPYMNGFEMLELVPEINFAIIFTTAHDRFAAQAFRISAIDYLLKPISHTDLVEAVQKAEKHVQANLRHEQVTNLLTNMKQPQQELQKIAFPFRDGYEFVEARRIAYCEAEGAYTKIHLGDGKTLLISRSLGDVSEMLPPDVFIRIHHSTMVNKNEVTHFIRSDGGYVQMKTGVKLMVSKSKKDQVMERLGLK